MTRKLATIRQIAEIIPIEGADTICQYLVDGWKVVDTIGKYSVEDFVIYAETDSWIPHSLAPFLSKGKEPRVFNGVQGEHLKTIKLRGALSQGLLIAVRQADWAEDWLGKDVSETLGIQLWEAPIPACLAGKMKGNFPSFIPKTDQPRLQNLGKILDEIRGESFEVTIKYDGSSLSCWVFNGVAGVASRNTELIETEGNAFWDIVKEYGLHEKITSTGRNLAVQGELTAPNIQNNHNQEIKPCFYCFDIYDIDLQTYLLPEERQDLCLKLGIPHVKFLAKDFVLNHTIDELLSMAEGQGDKPSIEREGLVFKSNSRDFSFKAISNRFLLKAG